MRRRKRKGQAQAESHERWLITYADLITLLMIFFVILYAMSQIDIKKYETLAQALQFEFRKADSVISMGSGLNGALDPAKYPEPAKTSEPVDEAEQDRFNAADSAYEMQRERELQDLLRMIQTYVNENQLQDQIVVEDVPKGIAIRLNDLFLFDLGKDDLKREAFPVLSKLASLFPQLSTTISIEGHTDNLPITGGNFKDNWGLSAARSLSVLRYFIDTVELDPEQFVIAGHADTRPVAPNDSAENRQRNRRVEITVLREG